MSRNTEVTVQASAATVAMIKSANEEFPFAVSVTVTDDEEVNGSHFSLVVASNPTHQVFKLPIGLIGIMADLFEQANNIGGSFEFADLPDRNDA